MAERARPATLNVQPVLGHVPVCGQLVPCQPAPLQSILRCLTWPMLRNAARCCGCLAPFAGLDAAHWNRVVLTCTVPILPVYCCLVCMLSHQQASPLAEVSVLCWQVQVIQMPANGFTATLVHAFSDVDQQPVASLSWLSSGAGAAMLVGNISNSTLRLWTIGETHATCCQALHLHAAPGKVALLPLP